MVIVAINIHGAIISVAVEDYVPGVNDKELRNYLSNILDNHLGSLDANTIYEHYKELLIDNALEDLGAYTDDEIHIKRS